MADGKDLLGHPVHMPRQEWDEIVSSLRSQAPHPDLNCSSKKTVIARKFHCPRGLLQNHFFKALDVRFVNFVRIGSEKSESIKRGLGHLSLYDDLKLNYITVKCGLHTVRANFCLSFVFLYIKMVGFL